MSHDQPPFSPEGAAPPQAGSGQQQQQSQADGHAGEGSDSILKELREWEQRRSVHSGGKRRNGPN